MNLAGELLISNEKYYLFVNDIKNSETFVLFNPVHESMLYDNDESKKVLGNVMEINEYFDDGYVMGAVTRLKVSGKVRAYKEYGYIENILSNIAFAKNYGFSKNSILINNETVVLGEKQKVFKAADDNIVFEYESANGLLTSLHLEYGNIVCSLKPVKFLIPFKNFEFKELKKLEKKNVLVASLKTVTYQTLAEVSDMTWYKVDGKKVKNYFSVGTIKEFETLVMSPLVLGIESAHKMGETFYVSLDTETDGLNVYNLSPDNENRNHCVAVILSWQEDQGVVIFTDMEHFDSIPNKYVWERLTQVFSSFKGTNKIRLYKESEGNKSYQLDDMDFFTDFSEDDAILESNSNGLVEYKTVGIERSWVNLIGHNVMFDKRVGIGEGVYIYFDDDTLQMAFDLFPQTVRGFNKLKGLTRRIFGHETPELEDILGKGNEDKYRYLVDKEVAEIYGCADGDYTRKVFMYLRGLMSEKMYRFYKMQDVPLLNILPRSEYYGLATFEDKVQNLAEYTYENLKILRNTIYKYVGSFIDYNVKRNVIEQKYSSGMYDSKEEYLKDISNITYDEDKYYEFDFKPAEIRKVLYDILKYPIYGYTEGAQKLPKTDKYVMKKLQSKKRDRSDTHFKRLLNDVLVYGADRAEYNKLRSSGDPNDAKKADSMVLISADKFNSYKYPLAYVLAEYATLNKEYTSYYKPIREENMEGKIFKSYSMARIETRRISNPAQTMKGNLKALIKAYDDDYYLLDFDMSQVEYRIMLSLAGHQLMVDRMKDPERDYHTETASLINRIQAHKVDKKTRKRAKGVSFGVPYGLGEYSLCENLFGAINDENLFSTRMILSKWEESNHPIVEFLSKARDKALEPCVISEEFRNFIGAWEKNEDGSFKLDPQGNKIPIPLGKVENLLGFYRMFYLNNIDFSPTAINRRANGKFVKEEAAIRRPAGNYPIQAFASELFRIILTRFYNRCEEEGINDKIIWHMLIHDELLCSVHKSIHPYYIYKLVKESCMVTMKGHTKYFVGINIGNTWAETKDDAREAPVYFVDRMIKKWDAGDFGTGPFWFDDPWEQLIKKDRAQYVEDRIGEVIRQIQPDIDSEPIDVPSILEKFSNYTVRAYVNDYSQNYEVDKKQFDLNDMDELNEYQDRVWVSKFETWALSVFGEGKDIINYDGVLTKLKKNATPVLKKKEVNVTELFEKDIFNDSEGEYWTFDEEEASAMYEMPVSDGEDTEDVFTYDMDISKDAKNIAQMIKSENPYTNLKVLNTQIIIPVDSKEMEDAIKEYLNSSISHFGKCIYFKRKVGGLTRWLCVKHKLNLDELDSFIGSLNSSNLELANISFVNKQAVIKVRERDKGSIKKVLKPLYCTSGHLVLLKNEFGKIETLTHFGDDELRKADELLNQFNNA